MPELRSGLYYMDGLAWLAVIFIFLSIFACMFIVFSLKFRTTKWRLDYHFRLRFSLAVILLLTCINQFVHFIFYMEVIAITERGATLSHSSDEIQVLRDQARLKAEVSYVFTFVMGYVVLFLMLCLTLDRYRRIHGIGPGMPLHTFFTVFSILLAISIVYIIIMFVFDYFLKYFIRPVEVFYIRNPLLKNLISTRGYVEATTFFSGALVHYYFTIALLVSCIKSVEDRGYWWRSIFTIDFKSTAIRTACSKQQKRLHLIIRMIRYFLVLFLSDIVVLIIFIIATDTSENSKNEMTFAFY